MASNDSGQLRFSTTLDASGIVRGVDQSKQALHSLGNAAVSEGSKIEDVGKKIATALGIGFSIQQAGQAISQIARVRGEYQQLEVAFTTMLKSKSRADQLMAQAVEFAATTPFELSNVSAGVKQLLAYGSEAENVMEEMKMLGDIAAGLSMPIGDLVYLYGTTRTQGRMFTMDLRQFMGRGIPLAEELAKQFGVTKNEVSKLVSEGKVGFKDLQQALRAMTSEGGMFYNLMGEQSKTITGQISNLSDSISQMFNNIGKSSEGIINKTLSGVSYLVENYEKVGKEIGGLVISYGAYKAAIMTVSAIKKAEIAVTTAEVVAKKASLLLNRQVTASNIVLAKSIKAVTAALSLNPYVLIATAVAGAAYGIYKLATAESEEVKVRRELNESIDAYNQKLSESASEAERLAGIMKSESETTLAKARAYNQLVSLYPELLDKYSEEELKLKSILDLKAEIAGINSSREDSNIEAQIAELERRKQNLTGTGSYKNVQAESLRLSSINEIDTKLNELYKIRDERAEAARQAAFDALPVEKKIAEYKKQQAKADSESAFYRNQLESGKNALTGKDLTDADIKILEGLLNKSEQESIKAKANIEALKKANKTEATPIDEDATKAYEKAKEESIKSLNNIQDEYNKKQTKNQLEAIELERKKRLAALDEAYNKQKDIYDKAGYGEGSKERRELDSRYYSQKQIINASADIDANKERKRQYEEDIKAYGTYMQKRALIDKEYNDIKARMYNADGTLKEGYTTENVAAVDASKQTAIEDLDQLMFENLDSYESIMAQIESYTLEQISSAIDALESTLDEIADPTARAAAEAQIRVMRAKQKSLAQKSLDNGDDSVDAQKMKWKELYEVMGEANGVIKEIGSTFDEETQNIVDSMSDIITGSMSMINGIVSLVEGSAQGVQSTAGAAATSLSTMEKASIILTIISAALQVAMAIAKLFDSDKKHLEEIERLNDVMDELELARKEKELIAIEKELGATNEFVAQTYNELRNEVVQSIKASDEWAKAWTVNQHQALMSTQRINDEIIKKNKKLADAYGNLSYAVGEALGSEKYKTARADLESYSSELLAIQASINEEESRRKKKRDEDRIAELKEKQRELVQEMTGLIDGYVEEILGGDYLSLATKLGDALVDAFENGTNAAQSWGQAVDDIVKDIVKQMMINELIAPKVKEIVSGFKEAVFPNGEYAGDKVRGDAIAALTSDLKDMINTEGKVAQDLWQQTSEALGFDSSSTRSASASTGVQATQDSIDELSGRATAIQGHTFNISNNTTELVRNTGSILNVLFGIRDDVHSIRLDIESMATRGITLR